MALTEMCGLAMEGVLLTEGCLSRPCGERGNKGVSDEPGV